MRQLFLWLTITHKCHGFIVGLLDICRAYSVHTRTMNSRLSFFDGVSMSHKPLSFLQGGPLSLLAVNEFAVAPCLTEGAHKNCLKPPSLTLHPSPTSTTLLPNHLPTHSIKFTFQFCPFCFSMSSPSKPTISKSGTRKKIVPHAPSSSLSKTATPTTSKTAKNDDLSGTILVENKVSSAASTAPQSTNGTSSTPIPLSPLLSGNLSTNARLQVQPSPSPKSLTIRAPLAPPPPRNGLRTGERTMTPIWTSTKMKH